MRLKRNATESILYFVNTLGERIMNILILGEVFSQNLGDAVICKTAYMVCKKEFPNAQIDMLDLSGRENYQRFFQASLWQKVYFRITDIIYSRLPTYDRPRAYGVVLSKLRKEIKEKKYDVAVFSGGALFTPYFLKRIYKIVSICEKMMLK